MHFQPRATIHLGNQRQARENHTEADRKNQVHKNRQQEDDNHDGDVVSGTNLDFLEHSVVQNVDTDGYQNAGQDAQRHIADNAIKAHEHGRKEQGADHAGKTTRTSDLNIGHRTHRGTGTDVTADKAAQSITDTLTDQFPVAVVLGLCHGVDHKARQKRVNASENRQNDAVQQNCSEVLPGHMRNVNRGKTRRDFADHRDIQT